MMEKLSSAVKEAFAKRHFHKKNSSLDFTLFMVLNTTLSPVLKKFGQP